jgi:predicted O-methyltransferase YrrM
MDLIKKILANPPLIHSGETEMTKYQPNSLSILSKEQQLRFANNAEVCWEIGEEALRFIHNNITKDSFTLEIGSGVTTLVFASMQSNHICITPNKPEIDKLQAYALKEDILLSTITFINDFSENALPQLKVTQPLDLILIDGKHAFPWPFIDWFYTVNHLKKNGILIIDDTHLLSGKILCDFMKNDPNWQFVEVIRGKTEVYKKVSDNLRDVAWHMQPFLTDYYLDSKKKKTPFIKKVKLKISSLFVS